MADETPRDGDTHAIIHRLHPDVAIHIACRRDGGYRVEAHFIAESKSQADAAGEALAIIASLLETGNG